MPVAAIIPALTALASIASTVGPMLMKGGGAKPAQPAPLAGPAPFDPTERRARTGGTLAADQPKNATVGFLDPSKGVGAGTSGPSADALRDLL